MPRQSPEVRRAATLRIKEMIDLVARQSPDWGQPGAHERALVTVATMVGTLMLARAVDDPVLSDALCSAAMKHLASPEGLTYGLVFLPNNMMTIIPNSPDIPVRRVCLLYFFEKGNAMKAFVVDRYGKQERLRAADVPEPDVQEDDVLIEVHATAVNQLDSKLRNGEFKLITCPTALLSSWATMWPGVVVRVGPRVRQFKVGDEVYARPDDFRIGTFAELIAVKEDSVAIKPKNITMEEAASIPLVGLTAWRW